MRDKSVIISYFEALFRQLGSDRKCNQISWMMFVLNFEAIFIYISIFKDLIFASL